MVAGASGMDGVHPGRRRRRRRHAPDPRAPGHPVAARRAHGMVALTKIDLVERASCWSWPRARCEASSGDVPRGRADRAGRNLTGRRVRGAREPWRIGGGHRARSTEGVFRLPSSGRSRSRASARWWRGCRCRGRCAWATRWCCCRRASRAGASRSRSTAGRQRHGPGRAVRRVNVAPLGQRQPYGRGRHGRPTPGYFEPASGTRAGCGCCRTSSPGRKRARA